MPDEQFAIMSGSTDRLPRPYWLPDAGHWNLGDVGDREFQYNVLERGGVVILGGGISGTVIAGSGEINIRYAPVPRYALQNEVEALYERIAALEAQAIAEPEPLREIPKDQAREEIRALFSEGGIIYMSDVADRLNLPDELVVEICLELEGAGELNRRDNAVDAR